MTSVSQYQGQQPTPLAPPTDEGYVVKKTVIQNHPQNQSLWMSLDNAYRSVEYNFINPVSYVPVVGMAAAGGRGVLAAVQFKTGLIGSIFEGAMTCLTLPFSESRSYHAANTGICVSHMVHSILNGVRAGFEWVPCLPWVTTMPYDLAAHKVWPYASELQNREITVIEERVKKAS